jgi:hypothetical protein
MPVYLTQCFISVDDGNTSYLLFLMVILTFNNIILKDCFTLENKFDGLTNTSKPEVHYIIFINPVLILMKTSQHHKGLVD